MRIRWKKFVLLPLLTILILISVCAYLLISTQWGNRTLLGYAGAYVDFTFSRSEGNVLDALIIHDVVFENEAMRVQAQRLELSVTFASLMQLSPVVKNMGIEQVELIQKAVAEENQPPQEKINLQSIAFEWPLDFSIEEFEISDVTFVNQEYTVDRFAGQIDVTNNMLTAQNIQFEDNYISAELSATVPSLNITASRVQYKAQSKLPEYEGSLSGEILLNDQGADVSGLLQASSSELFSIDADNYLIQIKFPDGDLTVLPNINTELLFNGWYMLNQQKSQLLNAKLNASTDWTDYQLDLSSAIDNDYLLDAQLEVKASGALNDFTTEIALASAQSGQTLLSSDVKIDDSIHLSNGRVNVQQMKLSEWLNYDMTIEQSEIVFSGEFIDPERITANLDINNLKLNTQGLNYDVKGKLTAINQEVNIEQLVVLGPKGQAIVEGTISDQQIDLAINTENFNLALAYPELQGLLSASVQLKGDLLDPTLNLQAQTSSLSLDNIQADNIRIKGSGRLLDFNVTGQIQSLQLSQQTLQEVEITVESIKENINISLSMQPELFFKDLKAADGQAEAVSETFSMQYAGQWLDANKNLLIDGQFKRFELSVAEYGLWKMSEATAIKFDPSKQNIDLQKLCLLNTQNEQTVCLMASGSLRVNKPTASDEQRLSPLTAQLELENVALDQANAFLPAGLSVEGEVEGQVNYSKRDGIIGKLELIESAIRYPVAKQNILDPIEEGVITFETDQNNISVQSNLTLQKLGYLKQSLNIGNWNGDAATVSGDGEVVVRRADLLSTLVPVISKAEGELVARSAIKGTMARPEIRLEGDLIDGLLINTQTGVQITDLSLDVTTTSQGDLDFSVVTKSESNALRLLGKGESIFDESPKIEAILTTQQFQFIDLPELKLKGSSDLTIEADKDLVKLSGEVTIEGGSYEGIETRPTAVLSEDAVVYRDQSLAEDDGITTEIDVKLSIVQPIVINTLGLSSAVRGNLRIKSNAVNGEIEGFGQLQLQKGTYKIYGQELSIDKGILDFNGQISNPSLQITTSRRISETLQVGVKIGGTVNRLSSDLFSTPALPETEILSYLITGRNVNAAQSTDTKKQLSQAATLLGVKSVLPKLQQALGVDVIDINQDRGAENTALEIEKNLNEDLSIGYSYGLFSEVGFWLLKYQLNQRLSLRSEYGEAQSVDLIYSIKRKD